MHKYSVCKGHVQCHGEVMIKYWCSIVRVMTLSTFLHMASQSAYCISLLLYCDRWCRFFFPEISFTCLHIMGNIFSIVWLGNTQTASLSYLMLIAFWFISLSLIFITLWLCLNEYFVTQPSHLTYITRVKGHMILQTIVKFFPNFLPNFRHKKDDSVTMLLLHLLMKSKNDF